MKIYRLENPQTQCGMWYRSDGTYDPFIKTLTEGKSKHLPMEYDEKYSQGGLKWFSGCGSIELMRHWFTARDAFELCEAGYKLYEFEASQFIIEEFQIIFTREGIQSLREIPLNTIWDVSSFMGQR